MRIGLKVNTNRDEGYACAYKTAQAVLKHGAVPVLRPEDSGVFPSLDGVVYEDLLKADPDVIISVGGDGTFLATVSEYGDSDAAFIGINKGSIGFLAQIDEDRLDECVEKIVSGDYRIINRNRLCVQVYSKDGVLKGTDMCLNDCSIGRGAKLHTVKLLLKVDGQVAERFIGDGLIISTATGSTAYNLAAGGPILMPEMRDMIITTNCSHTLNSFSYVVSPDSTVEIVVEPFETPPLICLDGRDFVDFEDNDRVIISSCEKPLKTIAINPEGFFSVIRRKIIMKGSFYENG
ncbi:NAD+ kinase [Ruminococcaceae bacterium YRB3002]|nr:NAD+ kinase [Ruminococcaceae bacterium YRB3002]